MTNKGSKREVTKRKKKTHTHTTNQCKTRQMCLFNTAKMTKEKSKKKISRKRPNKNLKKQTKGVVVGSCE